jgi:hypothetical protein
LPSGVLVSKARACASTMARTAMLADLLGLSSWTPAAAAPESMAELAAVATVAP